MGWAMADDPNRAVMRALFSLEPFIHEVRTFVDVVQVLVENSKGARGDDNTVVAMAYKAQDAADALLEQWRAQVSEVARPS